MHGRVLLRIGTRPGQKEPYLLKDVDAALASATNIPPAVKKTVSVIRYAVP